MNRVVTGIIITVTAALLSGCATTPQLLQVANAPAGEAIPAPAEYILGGRDIISIITQRHPEFTGVVIITREGRASFPLGTDSTFATLPFWEEIRLTGITKDQLEQEIAERLKRYLRDPRVSVSVLEYGSKAFYVVGEVFRPGRHVMRGSNINVREAIFEAGLTTPGASLRRTRLIRPHPENPTNKKVNLYALLYHGDLRHDLTLQPGDILFVPSTVVSKWNTVLAQILDPATRVASLQALYHQFDTDHHRRRFEYDKWFYETRPGFPR